MHLYCQTPPERSTVRDFRASRASRPSIKNASYHDVSKYSCVCIPLYSCGNTSRQHPSGRATRLQHSSNTSQSSVEPRSNHKTIHHTPLARSFYLLMMTAPLYMTEKVGMLTLRRFSASPDGRAYSQSELQPSASNHMLARPHAGSF